MFVHPGTFGMVEGESNKPGTLSVSSVWAARAQWLFHTTDGLLTVVGLVLAVAAQLINLTITIGKLFPSFIVGDTGLVVLNVITALCTIVGLFLIVWKGLLKEH